MYERCLSYWQKSGGKHDFNWLVIFVIISIMELELDHFEETTVVQLCMLFVILKISLNMRWEECRAHTTSHQSV